MYFDTKPQRDRFRAAFYAGSTNPAPRLKQTFAFQEREVSMYSLAQVSEQSSINAAPRATNEPQLLSTLTRNAATEFELLAVRYRPLVLAFVCRITRNIIEAEDLTQQALMKAFANYSSFAGRSSFSTWLISIARNEALMWYRKAQRSRETAMAELATGENSEGYLDFMDSRPNPEITYMQKERSRLLCSELKKLKPTTRKVVELCDLNEKSGHEVATMLGISTPGLKARKFRARAILRQRLESKLLLSKERPFADACTLPSSIHD
jgi:RNA polymerase sigma-70 factor, ECF subfamily